MERGVEDDSDDVRLDGNEDRVVARLGGGPRCGVLLGEAGTAFDVGEEEGDGARWGRGHLGPMFVERRQRLYGIRLFDMILLV